MLNTILSIYIYILLLAPAYLGYVSILCYLQCLLDGTSLTLARFDETRSREVCCCSFLSRLVAFSASSGTRNFRRKVESAITRPHPRSPLLTHLGPPAGRTLQISSAINCQWHLWGRFSGNRNPIWYPEGCAPRVGVSIAYFASGAPAQSLRESRDPRGHAVSGKRYARPSDA